MARISTKTIVVERYTRILADMPTLDSQVWAVVGGKVANVHAYPIRKDGEMCTNRERPDHWELSVRWYADSQPPHFAERVQELLENAPQGLGCYTVTERDAGDPRVCHRGFASWH